MRANDDLLLGAHWADDLGLLIEERLGYRLPRHRLLLEVAPFVLARTEQRGLAGPAALVEIVRAGDDATLYEELVEIVTIGETYFFRHPAQIRAVLAHACEQYQALQRPLRIWSAGCATGEEPLTLAMGLEGAEIPYEITGSDISRAALARAEAGGPYSERSVGHLPVPFRERWLVRAGSRGWQLKDRATLPVTYVRHGLVEDAPLRPSAGTWDIILCRNVMIYFPPDVARSTVERLSRMLATAGSLWLGPCDQVATKDLPLAWHGADLARFLQRQREPVRSAPSPTASPREPLNASGGPETWAEDVAADLERDLAASARARVDRQVRQDPTDGTAWVARAAFHIADHAFDQALADLDRASAARPRPPALAYLRGTTTLKAGHPEQALGWFLQALEDDPDDWASAWQAADLYRRRGRLLREELMVRRTLARFSCVSPAFGPAAVVVNSVHRDPEGVSRQARERLTQLTRLSGLAAEGLS